MAQNAWMWKSFVSGAAAVSLIVFLLYLASIRSTLAAAPAGMPIAIVSNPFIDLKSPSGGVISLSGYSFVAIIAMAGGLLGLAVTAVARWLRIIYSHS